MSINLSSTVGSDDLVELKLSNLQIYLCSFTALSLRNYVVFANLLILKVESLQEV